MNSQNDHRWHFDKKINIGHLLVTIAVAVFAYVFSIEHQVNKNTFDIQHLSENIVRLEKNLESSRKELRQEMQAANAKLDRLIERQMRSQGK